MSHHRIPLAAIFLALLIFLGGCASQAAAPVPSASEKIHLAVDHGVKYLFASQMADGTWEPAVAPANQTGGITALNVYALLTAGVSEKDPRLAKPIQYLMTTDISGVYALAFQALVLARMDQTPAVRTAEIKIARRLIQGGERAGAIPGLFGYEYNSPAGDWDHSCSQFGALGIWACSEAGIEMPDRIWQDIDRAWRKDQFTDGGWEYKDQPVGPAQSHIAMTAAGVATLLITDDALSWNHHWDCRGNPSDASIDIGMEFLANNMEHVSSLYEWYDIERIGIANGYKYFGSFDWFHNGVKTILDQQAADGSWDDRSSWGTALAILFLCRGGAPVALNKLRYDKDLEGNWNERPRDAATAAKFIGNQIESFRNWQVVTLAVDPDELHDAPILYLAGNEALQFTPEQEAKLRRFVEDGGMLLGNADCGAKAFSDSFKSLCQRLFDGQYQFRDIPDDHPIFTRQQFLVSKWRTRPAVEGLSNGVRELAILIPTDDASKAWQSGQIKSKRELFELVTNIYQYCVDKQEIAGKDVTYIVRPRPDVKVKSTIKLARLQYPGNWNPEPGGWRRLAAILHNDDQIDLKPEPVKLGAGALANYHIAHLTGTAPFQLDAPARAEIKQFIKDGGTLIVDAAGGSSAFADSAEKELAMILGDDAVKQLQSPLPSDARIFWDLKADDFKFRGFARMKANLHDPAIRGIRIDHRYAVIFSREDLSAGLVGENMDGIIGYKPDSATRLMTNFILTADR